MAKLRQQNRDFSLFLSESEVREMGLRAEKEYEFSRAREGIWVVTEKQPVPVGAVPAEKKPVILRDIETEGKILGLLQKKSLSERVEGMFEKLLSEKELAVFSQLLVEGKIVAFKLNDKYKKAVYKIAPPKMKESENISAKEKPIEEYSLGQDGFLVVKNEERAKRLSGELQEDIRAGKIKGLRSFDGHFYIIETPLLEKYSGQACAIIRANKSILLPQLAEKTGVSRTLARIVCEFLKEDGEIIEKRKEAYQMV